MRGHKRSLHVVDRVDSAARLGHPGHLLPRPGEQLGHETIHHLGALEDVRILEQVGLVGQDLLEPQRPLLVPRSRQAERLVPCRKLDSAGAHSAAE